MTRQFPSTAVYFQRKLRKASEQPVPEDLAVFWRKKLARRLRIDSELKRELESFASHHFYTNDFSKVHSEAFAEKVVAFCRRDPDNEDDQTHFIIDGLLQIVHGMNLHL